MLEELIEEYYELEKKAGVIWERNLDNKVEFCSKYLEELEIIEEGLRNNKYHKLNYDIERLRSKLLMELIL